jgi:hypothetical protein
MTFALEDRRRALQALRIRAEVDEKGDVLLSGVFDADITELLPMNEHPEGEPYKVRFREEIPPPHKGVVALDSSCRET